MAIALDDDDDVRQTQMTPGVRGDENWVVVALFLSFGGGNR